MKFIHLVDLNLHRLKAENRHKQYKLFNLKKGNVYGQSIYDLKNSYAKFQRENLNQFNIYGTLVQNSANHFHNVLNYGTLLCKLIPVF